MGFVSFVGRVLFASIFLLSAYQELSEFGSDGGPAAKSLKPKFNLFAKQLAYLAFITPVVYDFYNYEMESQQFVQLFAQFSQNLALFGALLFFLGMKNSIPRRHSKRRAAKAKTT